MPFRVVVFDAYGTLLDVSAAARAAADKPGFEALQTAWPSIAQDWRSKQLEYTWLRTIAGRHADFWQVTKDGLDWALDAAGITDVAIRDALLELYWALPAYPEAKPLLESLNARGIPTAILSNSTPGMLSAACSSAGLSDLLDATLSVEAVGVYKPHRDVYDMVCRRFDVAPGDVLFVSANGWDAAGAAEFGFTTIWINRLGAPRERLFQGVPHEVSCLNDVSAFVGV